MTIKKFMMVFILCVSFGSVKAQTEWDAIMMNKNQLCIGPMYTHSSWKNYWEGTLKRDNLNLGTVTSQSVVIGGNYGITNDLNVMVAVPYVWTKASAGTLAGQSGIQDVSAFVKWRAVNTKVGKGKFAAYLLGGLSTPLLNYMIDYLPLTIGLGSTNATLRGMVDYNINRITVTGSAAYVRRSNVAIDRNSYYDTQLRLTNEVKMPDQAQFQLRAGYRGRYLITEAILTNMTTLGGFDITRNNMPFPSNRMNATTAGIYAKYTLKSYTNLAFIGQANFTI
ncbi:MAG: hypothetical protein ACK5OP_04755, partial [Sphingobacteriales bacterium]